MILEGVGLILLKLRRPEDGDLLVERYDEGVKVNLLMKPLVKGYGI